MKYAIIENGRVANIAIAEPDFAQANGWIDVEGLNVQAGYFFINGGFVPNTDEINERLAANIRSQRDQLLADSDWVVTKALENNTGLDFDWATYRQALRDIPQQQGFPNSVVWPVAP